MFTVYKHHKILFVIEIVSMSPMSSVLLVGILTQFGLLSRKRRKHKNNIHSSPASVKKQKIHGHELTQTAKF